MARTVHAAGVRERNNVRAAPRIEEVIHRCRSCYAGFDESHETCPSCGFTDEHSTHGATQVEGAR